jgi:hypothetical protein
MLRYVLSLTFAVGLASAATISTFATCDGVTTTGTFSASCNDADITGFASASAMVQTGVPIGISVRTAAQSLMNPHSASASANISGDYVFTVFDGTGGGFFYPCFVGSFASHSGALGEGSFGGVGYQFTGSSSFPASNCRMFGSLSDFFPLSKPFTFGVPQIVPLSMGVLVGAQGSFGQDSAGESFPGGNFGFPAFFFFDPSGNALSNITFTLVEVPEPSAWSLLSIGWLFFVAVRRISNHQV